MRRYVLAFGVSFLIGLFSFVVQWLLFSFILWEWDVPSMFDAFTSYRVLGLISFLIFLCVLIQIDKRDKKVK
jgi:cytochrome c oxidase assembly factor CtaG